jgi:serpin B
MSKVPNVFMLICAALLLMQCSDNPTVPESEDPPGPILAEEELIARSNAFGFKLFKEISGVEGDRDVFISPLSVSLALGMALNGAKGDTRAEMEDMLGFAGFSAEDINKTYRALIDFLRNLDPDVQFQIANSIWSRLGFPIKREFLDLNRAYFDAEVRELDFDDPASVDTINGWVSDKTNGKIEEILKSIPPLAVMYLINAIYFKAAWDVAFDTSATQEEPFYLPDGSQTDCDMMYKLEVELPYFRSDDFAAVELPYGNGDFSMVILLPDQGIEIDAIIGSFNDENWSAWVASFETTEIDLAIPKFKVEYEKKLNEILAALGMEVAFIPYVADFTGISDVRDLFISEVKHKTFVDVNEQGTEAAAVTIVGIQTTGVHPSRPFFAANRPFVFAIKESRSGSILFIGKIVQPAVS